MEIERTERQAHLWNVRVEDPKVSVRVKNHCESLRKKNDPNEKRKMGEGTRN